MHISAIALIRGGIPEPVTTQKEPTMKPTINERLATMYETAKKLRGTNGDLQNDARGALGKIFLRELAVASEPGNREHLMGQHASHAAEWSRLDRAVEELYRALEQVKNTNY